MLHCACQSNRNTLTDEGIELVLTVMEAKELIGPPDAEKFDTFVRIYMVPDDTHPQQTKVYFISFQFKNKFSSPVDLQMNV